MYRARRVIAVSLLLFLVGCGSTGNELPLTTSMPRQTVGWAEQLTHENLAILTALPSALFGPYAASFLIYTHDFLYTGARGGIDAQVTLLFGEERQQEETTKIIQELGSALEVNMQDLLNRSPEREKTLNSYTSAVRQLLVSARSQKEALTTQRDDLNDVRREKRKISGDIQHTLNQSLREKNYALAGTKQQELTEAEKELAEIDVRLKNFQSLIDILEDLQEVGERRLIAIDRNRQALIAGVEVVEVPGIEEIGVFNSERRRVPESDFEKLYDIGPLGL